MAEKPKTVSIFNASKVGRRYELKGGIKLLAGRATEVPEEEAAFLLATLSNGRARFPDLVDSAKMDPAAADAKKALVDENAKLLAENASLKAQLEAASGKKEEGDDDKKKGGKSK